MSECEDFIFLRLQCLLDLALGHSSTNFSLYLVDFCPVSLKTAYVIINIYLALKWGQRTSLESYLRSNRCVAQEHSRQALPDSLLLDPTQESQSLRSRMAEHLWNKGPPWIETQVNGALRYGVKDTNLVIRRQSPNTGTKSGDTCDMEGCALAKRTCMCADQ